jgi:hypothetical protein
MKKYTVKDFLKLNSPCYSCGMKIKITVGVHCEGLSQVNLNMTIGPAGYTIPLSITYNNNLKLIIDPKTNRYLSSDGARFIKYIKNHKIFFITQCDHCLTSMTSDYLDFSLVGGYIKPVGIANQYLVLYDKNNCYVTNSEFGAEQSVIAVYAIKDGDIANSISNLTLPLLPHYRFKDKEHFMAKIKTYILFS